MQKNTLNITLDFGGGAENLFDNIKSRQVELDSSRTWKMRDFLIWIRDYILRERVELFMQGESLRPGILVLINETDWELLGELDYQIQDKDNLLFISTLHGG